RCLASDVRACKLALLAQVMDKQRPWLDLVTLFNPIDFDFNDTFHARFPSVRLWCGLYPPAARPYKYFLRIGFSAVLVLAGQRRLSVMIAVFRALWQGQARVVGIKGIVSTTTRFAMAAFLCRFSR